MKRVDTGAVNFTSISWGEDILEMVEYEPAVYFSDAIEEAEQGALNISPSQTVALDSEGRVPNIIKHPSVSSKGKRVNKVNRKIDTELKAVAGLNKGASSGKISDLFAVTTGPVGEPTTIRVSPSRPTPRRR
jgi:hypothetical protein